MSITRVVAALAISTALIACNHERADSFAGIKSCNADRAQSLIGREATTKAIAHAKHRTAARVVRVLRPDEMATADYRSDRLNITVDNVKAITAIRCG